MDIKTANEKYKITKIIALIEALLLFIIFILFYLTREVNVKRIIYVPKGNTNYTIKYLHNRGYDISYIDKIFIRMFGYPQAGWIDLKSTRMTKLDFLYRLTKSKAALAKVMIIPGETNYFIYKQIEKKLKIKNMYCPNIEEGFIKPDTYYLPIGMKREDLCKLLYDVSLKWHKDISKKIFGVWNYKRYEKYLIIASIIQKEAANTNEMKYVSAVIYNRLKKGMPLQMDGSLNYGKYSHTPITAKRIKTDKSRYNTYKYKGLPPKPVCVVSKEAIIAAIFPAKVKYLYFYKCGNHHLFATSYKAHVNNIRRCKK
ncbi:endolytic transglycosylase MltG [Caminibacter pacificus]|uniref:Endolytic murein transglycosylase n=1 Tax=Caminibacter pacificus TaxID=1424653 RepID=A0AAJ4REC2_9BACT|nr:endolytic transglycosylase MltG [Caminibacter pacificus]NPA87800.1 endolytic transglycosylase MltG [Campylobacterota bacterium]QCI29212.1 endolytic transglycosylase MltG [Caminibacter pacificus]ROR41103.1 UPF0755 protein [Caminibacter pacificus]